MDAVTNISYNLAASALTVLGGRLKSHVWGADQLIHLENVAAGAIEAMLTKTAQRMDIDGRRHLDTVFKQVFCNPHVVDWLVAQVLSGQEPDVQELSHLTLLCVAKYTSQLPGRPILTAVLRLTDLLGGRRT